MNSATAPLSDVRDISKIAYGFMASKALFVALEIDVFGSLAAGPKTLAELARETEIATSRLRTLLTACVSVGLLSKAGDRYANAPASQEYLVRTAPRYFGDYYRFQIDRQIYPVFGQLSDALHGKRLQFYNVTQDNDEREDDTMTNEHKREALLQLAKKRKADRRDGYKCLSDIHDGYYECDFVSPWTTSAHNVNADLMILGKDWASTKILEEQDRDPERRRTGQDENSKTNTNLRYYLGNYCRLEFSDTYATNVFPFIKCGSKAGRIRTPDMRYAADTYALPQIKIVSPLMAICLGPSVFRAVRRAALAEGGQEASEPVPHIVYRGVKIHEAPHPSVWTVDKMTIKRRWEERRPSQVESADMTQCPFM
jgi:restriction system protein